MKLKELATQASLSLSPTQVELGEQYISLVLKWNKTRNLVSRNCSKKDLIEDYDLLAEHYLLKGNYSKSKEIISKNPESYKDPKYLLLISNILIKESNFEEAREQALEAIEISKQPKIPLYIEEGKILIENINILSKD